MISSFLIEIISVLLIIRFPKDSFRDLYQGMRLVMIETVPSPLQYFNSQKFCEIFYQSELECLFDILDILLSVLCIQDP